MAWMMTERRCVIRLLSVGFSVAVLTYIAPALEHRSVPDTSRSQSLQRPAKRAPFDVVARVSADLDELRRKAGFPGATVGFVLPDGSLGEVVVGFADRGKQRALQVSDRLLSGSIGKTYVAAVALQLADEGHLDLDAKLRDWLGGEPWYDALPNGTDVTLRQLMCHRSGIPEHVLLEEFWDATRSDPDRQFAPHELVAFILGDDPLFDPGERFTYTDTNFVLLTMAMEEALGQTWYEMLRERSEMGWFEDLDLAVAIQINSDVSTEVGSTRELLVEIAKSIRGE